MYRVFRVLCAYQLLLSTYQRLCFFFAYCLNCLAYQLFVLTFLYIRFSVYFVHTGSSAYQLFLISAPPHIVYISASPLCTVCVLCTYRLLCVSAPPDTVYVSPPSLCTVYVLCAYQLFYVSAPLRISSSAYQLLCASALLRISSSAHRLHI